jgi:hypothetical protein
MKLAYVNFGISRLADGTPVLTPFGWVGKVYSFSQPLYDEFLVSMKITIALGLASLAVAGFRYVVGSLTGTHVWEFLCLALVLWDYLRIIVAYVVFLPGQAGGTIPASASPWGHGWIPVPSATT